MSYSKRTSLRNTLLAQLSPEDASALAASSRTEHAAVGRALTGQEVWFPHTCLISLTWTDVAGRTVQTGLVGPEGCLGLQAAFRVPDPVPDATVQIEGTMSVVQASVLRDAFVKRPSLQVALSEWLVWMAMQPLRVVACNQLHDLFARTCRWLLTMRERSGSDNLPVTQETLAQLLGGGRPRINQLLSSMEADGLLVRRRGGIQLMNLPALEGRACDCYLTANTCLGPGLNRRSGSATVPTVTDI